MLESFAILFVGDNFFPDENYYRICKFLLDQLHSLNFVVQKISFVQEDENVVTFELKLLSKEYDFVIVVDAGLKTNLLFNSLGNLCNGKSTDNSKFMNNLNNHVDEQYDDKMYPFIKNLKMYSTNQTSGKLYHFQRIFILKFQDVEALFLQLLKNHLIQYQEEPKFKKKFQLSINEMTNENNLKIINESLVDRKNDLAIIQVEKTDFEAIVDVELLLRKQFSDKVIEICDNNFKLEDIFYCRDEHILEAIQTIEKCLETYGLENVFLTFNGGKDCTVLLHLLNIVRKIRYPECQTPMACLYVRDNDTFPEQDKFVAQCQVYYNLDIISLSLGMKEALAEFMNRKPNLKACFLGTRRTDPYSDSLKTFQMTDSSWPSVMRVSPLLDWHYSDIWNYILFYKVPYCKLYDQGYTSLGSSCSTIRNPSLLHKSVKLGKEIYLPAYKLLNEAEERSGRNTNAKH